METSNWYAMYTRYKSEKIAEDYFLKTGLEAYVPAIKKTKRYQRKIKTYRIPLISCYVFVKLSKTERIKALRNPYVIQFLKIGGEMHPIPEEEIMLLKKITGEINNIEVVDLNSYQVGDRVEIINGNLTGLIGEVLEHRGTQDFIIELNHIVIRLRLEVDPKQLRKVNRTLENHIKVVV